MLNITSIKKLFFIIIGLSILWTGDVDARRSQRHRDSEKADAEYRRAVAKQKKADENVAKARKNRRAARKKSPPPKRSSSRRASRQKAVAPVQRNFEVTDIGNGTSKINTIVHRDVYHGRRKVGTVPHVQASRIVPTSTTQQALSEEMAKAAKVPPPPPVRLSKKQSSQKRSPFVGRRKGRR